MNLEKLFATISGLSGTYRFSNAKLMSPENVLEHMGGVVLTCYLLCREMNKITPETIDSWSVMAKAAIHDVEELLMGDIPRSTKYATKESRSVFLAQEKWAMVRIMEDLDLKCADEVIYDHYAAKLLPSGVIVEIADVLAVVGKVYEECIERSNHSMISRASSCRGQIIKSMNRVKDQDWSQDVKIFLSSVLMQAMRVIDQAEGRMSGSMISEVMS